MHVDIFFKCTNQTKIRAKLSFIQLGRINEYMKINI